MCMQFTVLWYNARNDILPCSIGPIVCGSDSELEVQRHGTKQNTVTDNPIMLEDVL